MPVRTHPHPVGVRAPRLWATALAVVGLCLALVTGVAPGRAHAATATAISVDGNSQGRTFDGVGAISGGGGNTRLLVDYPEPRRSQILDYLFKPGYGASLQILKVEIGGDTNTTDGAESSIEHSPGTINCNNGYEWWLMRQAKQRNPHIKLYGLAWGAPGFLGGHDFWSTTSPSTVDYLMNWLDCAKQHNFTIDYLGGWNERYDRAKSPAWYKALHAALAKHGYATKVVGADNDWAIADDIASDSALSSAVDIVGAHYVCGYRSSQTNCSSTANAQASGKQLWASENGSDDADAGAMAMARGINHGYLDAKLTAYINWPLVASISPNLDYNGVGLVQANQPWSGAYNVGRSTWTMAQTSQFTSPGWKYLDASSGYLGGNRAGGSYVSYAAPDKSAWSTVFETMDATADQTVSLSVTGGLPGGTLHVWTTDQNAGQPRMVAAPDLSATGGTYQLTLQPKHLYTVTTTTGQAPGTVTGPQRTPQPLPYSDSFAGYPSGAEAKYFAGMNGAFEAAPCGGGRSGQCLRQMTTTPPIQWTNETANQPYTTMGDVNWSDYTVSTDVLLERSGGAADLLGHVGWQKQNNNGLNAYHLTLDTTGTWALQKSDQSWNFTTLSKASGKIAKVHGTDTWHKLSLTFQGSTITAKIDGTQVASVTDTSYGAGQIGLGTVWDTKTHGYYGVQYSNLSVTPGTAPSLKGTYNLVNVNSGMLLDAADEGTSDGTPIIQWPANGGANQKWTLTANADGYYTITNVGSDKTLDVPAETMLPGTQLDLWGANGGTNQQWAVTPSTNGAYTIESRNSGHLVDVSGASTSQNTPVIQWNPNGGSNQQWKLVKAG
ncbi:RICIN domain-containing protein [Streptomyces griseochromogenes]|uniref:RICIN domain-containing protein n=1 Tax=Streptomyces griseochromogenes TaxID=68214 RepID=UPI003797BDD2